MLAPVVSLRLTRSGGRTSTGNKHNVDPRWPRCYMGAVMSKNPKLTPDEIGFELVLTKLTRAEIARGLGIKKQNLTRWKRVPPHHVAKISALTGLAREDILPSMFA